MADASDAEWDEWGDDHDVPSAVDASRATPPSSPLPRDSNAPSLDFQSHTEPPPPPPRELFAWTWDLDAIDAELAALAPSSDAAFAPSDKPTQPLDALASLAGPTRERLRELGARTTAMRAQAAVAQWRLRQLERALATDATDDREDDATLAALAGDWGRPNGEDTRETHATLDDMMHLLQHAREACDDGDVTPFQQALEQLFASRPAQSLAVPTSWIRSSPVPVDHGGTGSWIATLVALSTSPDDSRVRPLTDAQVFQDTKDIQRDEVVVAHEHVVGGAVGYNAVIAAIENHLRRALSPLAAATKDDDATLRYAAQYVLSACNRTESGGCSYEIVSQLLTQHATDRVLIRPASAKAPPLQVTSDVGVFWSRDAEWCVGLRVHVAAVTYYCLCDADDPTHELYEIETRFTNRLAFPLGYTALAPRDLWRRDSGDVTVTLRTDGQPAEQDVDFDALM